MPIDASNRGNIIIPADIKPPTVAPLPQGGDAAILDPEDTNPDSSLPTAEQLAVQAQQRQKAISQSRDESTFERGDATSQDTKPNTSTPAPRNETQWRAGSLPNDGRPSQPDVSFLQQTLEEGRESLGDALTDSFPADPHENLDGLTAAFNALNADELNQTNNLLEQSANLGEVPWVDTSATADAKAADDAKAAEAAQAAQTASYAQAADNTEAAEANADTQEAQASNDAEATQSADNTPPPETSKPPPTPAPKQASTQTPGQTPAPTRAASQPEAEVAAPAPMYEPEHAPGYDAVMDAPVLAVAEEAIQSSPSAATYDAPPTTLRPGTSDKARRDAQAEAPTAQAVSAFDEPVDPVLERAAGDTDDAADMPAETPEMSDNVQEQAAQARTPPNTARAASASSSDDAEVVAPPPQDTADADATQAAPPDPKQAETHQAKDTGSVVQASGDEDSSQAKRKDTQAKHRALVSQSQSSPASPSEADKRMAAMPQPQPQAGGKRADNNQDPLRKVNDEAGGHEVSDADAEKSDAGAAEGKPAGGQNAAGKKTDGKRVDGKKDDKPAGERVSSRKGAPDSGAPMAPEHGDPKTPLKGRDGTERAHDERAGALLQAQNGSAAKSTSTKEPEQKSVATSTSSASGSSNTAGASNTSGTSKPGPRPRAGDDAATQKADTTMAQFMSTEPVVQPPVKPTSERENNPILQALLTQQPITETTPTATPTASKSMSKQARPKKEEAALQVMNSGDDSQRVESVAGHRPARVRIAPTVLQGLSAMRISNTPPSGMPQPVLLMLAADIYRMQNARGEKVNDKELPEDDKDGGVASLTGPDKKSAARKKNNKPVHNIMAGRVEDDTEDGTSVPHVALRAAIMTSALQQPTQTMSMFVMSDETPAIRFFVRDDDDKLQPQWIQKPADPADEDAMFSLDTWVDFAESAWALVHGPVEPPTEVDDTIALATQAMETLLGGTVDVQQVAWSDEGVLQQSRNVHQVTRGTNDPTCTPTLAVTDAEVDPRDGLLPNHVYGVVAFYVEAERPNVIVLEAPSSGDDQNSFRLFDVPYTSFCRSVRALVTGMPASESDNEAGEEADDDRSDG